MGAFLEDEAVILRTVGRNDLDALEKLMSDRSISMLSGEVYPVTEKEMGEFYERAQKTDDRIWLLIEMKDTGDVIGETGFLRFFAPWRTADYSLMIWRREYWGKGIGRKVANMMLDYGFDYLNLHRISIGVVEKNRGAMAFWKSVGFKEEGRQDEGFFSEGEYSDFVMMRMLEGEFRKTRAKD